MRVLPADPVATPPLARAIEDTDPGLARDVSCTHAQLGVRSPSPLNRITVGDPEPTQRRYRL